MNLSLDFCFFNEPKSQKCASTKIGVHRLFLFLNFALVRFKWKSIYLYTSFLPISDEIIEASSGTPSRWPIFLFLAAWRMRWHARLQPTRRKMHYLYGERTTKNKLGRFTRTRTRTHTDKSVTHYRICRLFFCLFRHTILRIQFTSVRHTYTIHTQKSKSSSRVTFNQIKPKSTHLPPYKWRVATATYATPINYTTNYFWW